MLKEIDPEEVQNCKYGVFENLREFNRQTDRWIVFHVDGEKNINLFGFPIHNCIDGCSMKCFDY